MHRENPARSRPNLVPQPPFRFYRNAFKAILNVTARNSRFFFVIGTCELAEGFKTRGLWRVSDKALLRCLHGYREIVLSQLPFCCSRLGDH